MFSNELAAAHKTGDKRTICRLIESISIPKRQWTYPEPHVARAFHEGTGIQVWSTGRTGINSYESLTVFVHWPDGTVGYLGQFSSADLRLQTTFLTRAANEEVDHDSLWSQSGRFRSCKAIERRFAIAITLTDRQSNPWLRQLTSE
jgi:hypothetical protein